MLNNNNNSVRDAASKIKSGDVIWVGYAKEISDEFLEALADRHDELHNVTIVGYNFLNLHEFFGNPAYSDSFKVVNFTELPRRVQDRALCNVDNRYPPQGSICGEIAKELKVNVLAVKTCPANEKGQMILSGFAKYATCDMLNYSELETTIGIVDPEMKPAKRFVLEREMRLMVNAKYFDFLCESEETKKTQAA